LCFEKSLSAIEAPFTSERSTSGSANAAKVRVAEPQISFIRMRAQRSRPANYCFSPVCRSVGTNSPGSYILISRDCSLAL
jgi:hypothetical protein